MTHRSTLLAAVAALPLVAANPTAQEDANVVRWVPPDTERLIFHAVLEGLYHDGVSNEVVDALVELDEESQWPRHFIYACPICMPAFNAFRTYRARPGFLGDKAGRDTFGDGLPDHVKESLLSDDPAVRIIALRERVSVWVGRRIDSLRLDERELGLVEERLGSARKEGLYHLRRYKANERTASIYAHMESCPFCDGANEPMGG